MLHLLLTSGGVIKLQGASYLLHHGFQKRGKHTLMVIIRQSTAFFSEPRLSHAQVILLANRIGELATAKHGVAGIDDMPTTNDVKGIHIGANIHQSDASGGVILYV